jgi:hypothetical protein
MGSTSIPDWIYQRLTRHDAPRPADLIFVLAGRMERKQYGLDLYRAGFAPRLLLSVGRFEVSRMGAIGFDGAHELIACRDGTAPGDRHFFCELSGSGLRLETPRLGQWNTYGELEALREFLKHDMPRSVIFLSTDIHLRRVALTFARLFRDAPLEACFCPVPAEYGTRPGLPYVLAETFKLAGYRAILRLPESLIRRVMRLRRYLG